LAPYAEVQNVKLAIGAGKGGGISGATTCRSTARTVTAAAALRRAGRAGAGLLLAARVAFAARFAAGCFR
jgi:hypothetical protein